MLNALQAWDERMFRLINENWLNATLDLVLPFVTDARNYFLLFVMAAIILVVMGRLHGLRLLILAVVQGLTVTAALQGVLVGVGLWGVGVPFAVLVPAGAKKA